jgi:hypothetical protein
MAETFTRFDGEDDVEFEAELLAEVSSERPTVQRWSEVEVFRCLDGAYIVITIGRSTKPGERDYYNWHESENVPDLIRECRLRNGNLPPLTMSALLLACQKDQHLRHEVMKADL